MVSGEIEWVRFEVRPEREELGHMERYLDRLCVLAEAAYDLGMVEEYAAIEEAAEELALRLQARRAA